MNTFDPMNYHAEAMANEMTMQDARVKAIKAENMAKVQGMAKQTGKHMTGAKYTEWQCPMSANYGGKCKK